ncbi:AGE family epimerase/isomerase [Albibacterium bauzanense]|uniref:Cellobiose 2-epimerase n=1 Tax=Albibacterium bauzanense TaxID=653929 RepID=A0A4V2PXX6_9SPHI|nr:AGE family epimerase/isomerase [Albibacterium bauzanense]TCK83351.1 mannobiose 2-epimerase [Albibacterium bauzanense]
MNEEVLSKELNNILDYWSNIVYDKQRKLFFGRIDNSGNAYPEAPLGAVLYARILWSFSAGYAYTKKPIYKERALQAYKVIEDGFFDKEAGGIYWSILPNGEPLQTRKQIYAQAFVIYALAELYKIEPRQKVINEAFALVDLIEEYSYDIEEGGYLEALSQNWQPIKDMRLSDKDINAIKTMNTHLHILEAYTNLYAIKKDKKVGGCIKKLLDIFTTKIICSESKHLQLFFTKNWKSLSSIQSYGHDIEASWLLMKAAELVYGKGIPQHLIEACNALALITVHGLLSDGSLANEKENDKINKERHCWVQAEAMVGFHYMGLRTKNRQYFQFADRIWNYVNKEIRDPDKGEWFWGRDENGNLLQNEDKVGMWKCPYHNSRACLEILQNQIKVN